MLDNICKKCFFEKGDNLVCPKCGFDGIDDSESHSLLIGTILNGKYIVGRVLGQGGFGITYLGYDLNLGVKVAIKEYFPNSVVARSKNKTDIVVASYDGGKSFKAGLNSFLKEARIVTMFSQNPNIITIREYFTENNTAYMVMDYILGMDLIHYVKQKKRPLYFLEAIELLNPIMSALTQVHSKNLLHRDISPDNIYITKDKTAILLDFGAARQFSMQTQSMSVILKVAYSPIEQHQRKSRSGPWTDVYAFAATFYHMITGRKPPTSIDRLEEDELELPSSLGVDIPKKSESALVKALAVRANDRYQAMGEFYTDINAPVFVMREADRLRKEKVQAELHEKQRKYELACEHIDTKEYKKAIKILKTIPGFKDSGQLIFNANKSILDKKQIDLENKQRTKLAKKSKHLQKKEENTRTSNAGKQQNVSEFIENDRVITSGNNVKSAVFNSTGFQNSPPEKRFINNRITVLWYVFTAIIVVCVVFGVWYFVFDDGNRTVSAYGQNSTVNNPIVDFFDGLYEGNSAYSKKNAREIEFLKEDNSIVDYIDDKDLTCFTIKEGEAVYSWSHITDQIDPEDFKEYMNNYGYIFEKELKKNIHVDSGYGKKYLYKSPNTKKDVIAYLWMDEEPRIGIVYDNIVVDESNPDLQIDYYNGGKSARLTKEDFMLHLGENFVDFSGLTDVEREYSGLSFSGCEEYCCYSNSDINEINKLKVLFEDNGYNISHSNSSYLGEVQSTISYLNNDVRFDIYEIDIEGQQYIVINKYQYYNIRESLNQKEKEAYDLLKDELFNLVQYDCDSYFGKESLSVSFDYRISEFSLEDFVKELEGYNLDDSIVSEDYFRFSNNDGDEISISINNTSDIYVYYRKFADFEHTLEFLDKSEDNEYKDTEFDSIAQLVDMLDIDYVDIYDNKNTNISWNYSNYSMHISANKLEDDDVIGKIIERAREKGYTIDASEYNIMIENNIFSWYIDKDNEYANVSLLPNYYGGISIR